MAFTILDNITPSKNHFVRLKELFAKNDHILIVSPFLMSDLSVFFSELKLYVPAHVHLITTLAPGSPDQIKKINSLVSFINSPRIQSGEITCQISLNNRLHGKIYIFKKSGNNTSAIVTSANFTDSGLYHNHEWGIEITDKSEIGQLEKSILHSIEIQRVSFDSIYKMHNQAMAFLKKHPGITKNSIDLNLTEALPHSLIASLNDEVSYWLKPIGVTNNPIPENRLYNNPKENMHFSKRRPNSVKENDILIAFVVGSGKIVSLFKVLSKPQHVTEEEIEEDDWLERWPWYVEVENLTMKFGETWAEQNLRTKDLVAEYLDQYPDYDITDAGTQSLGAFNFGQDKLKLSRDFAHFVMERVLSTNDRL